ncbi:unnamed protein product [Citrullus colocynthis]|uniref:F-box associated beta-propeller type 1 domain-containing protein n=1 Tax=Citrullus colocynthis TaxID=252529 RepID=A0ABP0YTI0_9ROSI
MTNEYMEVPTVDCAMNFDHHMHHHGYGFGFSPNIKQYKIVRIPRVTTNGLFVADIFTFDTLGTCSIGKWTSVSIMPFTTIGRNDGFYLNGRLYWIGSLVVGRVNSHCLLCFDVEHENFEEICFPGVGRQPVGTLVSCFEIQVFNGSLYLSGFDFESCWDFHVWKMMEQDCSWTKEFVVPLLFHPRAYYSRDYMISKFYHLQFIKAFEDGKFLFAVFQMELILYDPKTKKTEALDHKLYHGIEEKLWIYEIDSFNFGSIPNILGLNS